ncbi:DNA polymerase beta superfamily protein [Actinokineospora xionganensis]|uniref:DNA polymerase beta superfamily protein n=1 Tax=Actinokineospora xionganensis TaxID=2684470 RepID=UPI001C9BD445|nr:nucleotidyltransferase domain-containing protein [Actinokineospora xionganensis]
MPCTDVRKFARLLLTPNGYVLEQLVSPLVVHTGEIHAELLSMVPGLLTGINLMRTDVVDDKLHDLVVLARFG